MKKIIAVTTLFIICVNVLFAQPSKRKAKKPNNFSWGATNPTVKASKSEVAIETLEVKNGKKPNANNTLATGRRTHKPLRSKN